jgi:hypothetical protein
VYAVIAEGCAEGKGTHSTGKASELGGAGGGCRAAVWMAAMRAPWVRELNGCACH